MEAELDDLKQSTKTYNLLDDSNLELLEEQAEQELGFRQSTTIVTT